MKRYFKILLLSAAIVCPVFQAKSQGQKYTWATELELLKRIDKLPAYRSGQIVEQISSYDRKGGNNDGFEGTYSYIRKEKGGLVIADLTGPGVVNRIWTPTPTNDTLAFYFDGEKRARLRISFIDLFSGKVFPFVKPICGNEAGGYYCYIPIPYQKSLKIVFEGGKILFHQIQYRNMPKTNVESWTGNFTEKDKSLLNSVSSWWSDISPSADIYTENAHEAGQSSQMRTSENIATLNPGDTLFYNMDKGGRIIGLEIDAGAAFESLHKDFILSATWDNEKVEAIYAPVADFFGYAYGKGAMRNVLIGKKGNLNYSYLPMPFDKSAQIKLIYTKREGANQFPIPIKAKISFNESPRDAENEGKLYAIWRREKPEKGKFYEFLSHKGKGHYIGTIHQAQGLRPGMTLFFEGDDSTYVDGKMRLHGTGSEDYYNGGWYALLDRWDRGVSMPIHGSLDYSLPMARTGGYRFFLTDKMSFEKEIYHGMEHGPERNEFPVDYISVAFFYSANPLSGRMEPTEELREVYLPREHVYFPQLMNITPGGGVQVIHDRGIRINTLSQGMVRIMLDDVPEGKYKLSISYFEKPRGAEFQIWQRQKQLSEWIKTLGEKEQLKERIYINDIELTKQTNSVTFHVRGEKEGSQFELDRIYLERID